MDQGALASVGEVQAPNRLSRGGPAPGEDHGRIAQAVDDVVVHRQFAQALNLVSALGLLGEHRATPRIHHAVSELDQAIRDLRDTISGYDRALTDDRGATGN